MKFFIFGSTGDLVKRKVVPALSNIFMPDLEIIALGRRDFIDESYNAFICESGMCFNHLNKKPEYNKIDFKDEIVCEKCIEELDKENTNFFYSAMPPQNIEIILEYVGKLKKSGFKVKILIEKPFGGDLESAENLKKVIEKVNLVEDVFISDHYVFKDEILKLKKTNFKKIKIVSLENVGLENRVGYYDDVGALKDMVQNHFLNIVFKLIDNPEEEFENFEIISFEKSQYGNGKDIGYIKELGKDSKTETFVKILLKTKTKEIEFITGKKFNKKISFIEIDGEKTIINNEKNSYEVLISEFLAEKKINFPTVDKTILSWKIIDKIKSQKTELKYYPENIDAESFI
ncbi:MAG: hypothetical protein WC827_01410 [Candidatus Paceibacterota bacterium]|jgi:glucose-6-phosphate 1-dehydrogenase